MVQLLHLVLNRHRFEFVWLKNHLMVQQYHSQYCLSVVWLEAVHYCHRHLGLDVLYACFFLKILDGIWHHILTPEVNIQHITFCMDKHQSQNQEEAGY